MPTPNQPWNFPGCTYQRQIELKSWCGKQSNHTGVLPAELGWYSYPETPGISTGRGHTHGDTVIPVQDGKWFPLHPVDENGVQTLVTFLLNLQKYKKGRSFEDSTAIVSRTPLYFFTTVSLTFWNQLSVLQIVGIARRCSLLDCFL